ncbi:hypothetical protein L2E82_08046 [Cichorium intybus]|uniref:Uncharacterized protein n=1 Tax=Cichorium intybus TaxID=13427 RepID=A0ACB9G635_CICIN|nr:hypothetical protein L2E82_08046 [Cichorium intybus]
MHLRILVAVVTIVALGAASAQPESHCEKSCGNVTIRYPFDIGDGCYYNSHFNVDCVHYPDNSTLYLATRKCYNSSGLESYIDTPCLGAGCCEIAVPQRMSSVNITLSSYDYHEDVPEFNPCSYGFFVKEGMYNFSTNDLRWFQREIRMPMLLEWSIGNSTGSKDVDSFIFKGNSTFNKNYTGPGYQCVCKDGYGGNPYIP